MDNTTNKDKGDSPLKSSKALLYSEHIGATVVEHVLESLEKGTNTKDKENTNIFRKTFPVSTAEPTKRAKELLSMIEEKQKSQSDVSEDTKDDDFSVEMVLDIIESPIDDCPDIFFIGMDQEPECSECGQVVCNCPQNRKYNSEYESSSDSYDSDSSDSYDGKYKLNTSSKKVLSKKVHVSSSPISSDEECKQNSHFPMEKESPVIIVQDDSLDSSDNEENSVFLENEASELSTKIQYFPSTKKRKLITVIDDESSDIPESECSEKPSKLRKEIQ